MLNIKIQFVFFFLFLDGGSTTHRAHPCVRVRPENTTATAMQPPNR